MQMPEINWDQDAEPRDDYHGELIPVVGGYRLTWTDLGIRVVVRNVKEDGRGIRAELQFVSANPGARELLYHNIAGLLSPNSKAGIWKDLEGRWSLSDKPSTTPLWDERIETLCSAIVSAHRQGAPIETIGGDAPIRSGRAFRVNPFLPEGVITILFGDGGTGKSYLALMMALLVQTGERRLGMEVQQGNVLYLDYETDQPTLHERAKALSAGLELDGATLKYRRCHLPVAREIDRVHQLVEKYEIDLLVHDSVGMSLAGTAIADDVVIEMLRTMRTLGCTCLLVDHISKATEGKGTPFGSAYKTNEARSTWQVMGRQDPGTLVLHTGIYHRKVNDGAMHPNIGFEFTFRNNSNNRVEHVAVKREDMAITFFDELSGNDKILQVLKETGAMHYREVASETGIPEKTVSSYLTRMQREKRVIRLGSGEWGLSARKGNEISF